MADVSGIKQFLNRFLFRRGQASGMYSDAPLSQQPEHTYINAWGVSNQSTDEKGGGLYNSAGMDDCAALPEGWLIRGYHFREESDRKIYFLSNGDKSEIGYVDLKTCKYHKIIDDKDVVDCLPGQGLLFGENQWIPIESKYMRNGTCFELHIYWTNGTYYKRLNIDRPLPPIDCDELYLLQANVSPTPDAYASETGGYNLEGGVYQYLAQPEDNDGNKTNFFHIGHPVAIETPNNAPGERSTQAIHVKLTNLNPDYHKVNLAVIKTVGGHTSAHLLAKLNYSSGSVSFLHRSTEQEQGELSIEHDILKKKNGYFRGDNIFQYDGRLMPFELLGEENEDWQQIFDEIEVYYRIVGVPLQYAHLVSGFRADENYFLGIRGNYIDGTTSRGFVVKGRKASASDLEIINPGDQNCLNCAAPRWKVENTAERTELICDNPEDIGAEDENINYDTGEPIFVANPEPEDDITEADDPDVLDDIGKTGDQHRRQMECICNNMAFTFALFELYIRLGVTTIPEKYRELLSDPVAIATLKCTCEEMAKHGGADGDDTISDGSDDYGRGSPREPIGKCPCCADCAQQEMEGRTDEKCPCCDDCP